MKSSKITEFANYREKSGLSVKEIARKIGKSERTVYRYEKGEVQPPVDTIRELKSVYEKNSMNEKSKKPGFQVY